MTGDRFRIVWFAMPSHLDTMGDEWRNNLASWLSQTTSRLPSYRMMPSYKNGGLHDAVENLAASMINSHLLVINFIMEICCSKACVVGTDWTDWKDRIANPTLVLRESSLPLDHFFLSCPACDKGVVWQARLVRGKKWDNFTWTNIYS